MQAAVVEAPGHLTVRAVPQPKIGEYQALCQMLYGAVCTGTDSHIVSGEFPWPPRYPAVLGHESIGKVVEVGARVRHLRVGDVVTRVGTTASPGIDVIWGGFVAWGVAHDHQAMSDDGLPPDQWNSFRVQLIVPPDIAPAEATMMITWRETLSYIQRMGVAAGARILVIGSGGNGLAFAAHAHNLGAGVVAMLGSANREATARAVGVNHYCCYREIDALSQLGAAARDGFDFIIDAVGKRGQLDATLPMLRAGGMVGVYGLDDWQDLVVHPLQAPGSFSFFNGGYDEAETHKAVIGFMRSGRLQAKHWLNLETPFRLEQINEAMIALQKRDLVKALIRLQSHDNS